MAGVSIPYRAPRATRPVRGRAVAGVAAGLAQNVHLPVWLVRTVFVVLAFAGGMGIVLYAAFWAVLPLDAQGTDAETASARSSDTARLLALAAVVVGIGFLLAALGVNVASGAVIPVIDLASVPALAEARAPRYEGVCW